MLVPKKREPMAFSVRHSERFREREVDRVDGGAKNQFSRGISVSGTLREKSAVLNSILGVEFADRT
jgi:hypothetical protein